MTVQTVLRTTASGAPVKTVGDVPDCFKEGAGPRFDCFNRTAPGGPGKTVWRASGVPLKTVRDVPDCFNRGATGGSP